VHVAAVQVDAILKNSFFLRPVGFGCLTVNAKADGSVIGYGASVMDLSFPVMFDTWDW
jgi:hypothetical protein